ncbi:metallophosphoesterase [Tabrizicola oligotrophica]|uniref:Serine/threonine protein phosphatase n=1 Tax=Tabrizicola oligotrophica TaxID=2710650 RepID=A0A6M0QTA1_9RHOB|nr:metallophosphoesterase [Tabrizicola oligotrophica]NEY89672.1 serine/threonine protein phosphatase [Tabrizicola oligotrophica]
MRTYAIGDIHGQLALLQAAHARIAADQAAHGPGPVVHIGDLVDRGPDSPGVIEHLMQGIARGEDWVVLKGNHDRMFAGYLRDLAWHDPRLRVDASYLHPKIGGVQTLASYGVKNAGDRPLAPVHGEAVAAVPRAHRDFLETLPTSFARGAVFYAHAGIRPGVPLERQTEDDLCWIRDGFLEDRRDHGPLIVHGHTHLAAVTHYGNRLNLDSGAAYGGPLSAVVIEGRTAFLLTDQGRQLLPVTPNAPIR